MQGWGAPPPLFGPKVFTLMKLSLDYTLQSIDRKGLRQITRGWRI